MLGKLLTRWSRPGVALPEDAHLFGSPPPRPTTAQHFLALRHRYKDALLDEPVPPQYRHFNAFAGRIHLGRRAEDLADVPVNRLRAAFATCFEPPGAFAVELRLWEREPAFHAAMLDVRRDVVAELTLRLTQQEARNAYYCRLDDCLSTPLDIRGENMVDLIQQMSPDDWHEIALRWDWDHGGAEFDWITAQRSCDRATALYVLCSLQPGEIATGETWNCIQQDWDYSGLARAIAARLEDGFYSNAEFGLALSLRQERTFRASLEQARATGQHPWIIPADLLDHEGVRLHQPRYSVTDGVAHFDYGHWLERLAG
ncbi:MAG: DUF4274 domain-containing protein [Hyphomonadaceae bacterium]